ncbi:MAG TPA: hypothetical protein VGN72_03595 [Tepidisphaeraceae bacterium]|jgi:hypothetical protein|nr:hypothetical protein [Tepidisphaeraceae bacterium]
MRNPEALPETVGALTAGFAAQLAVLKASGVERNFHYPAPNAGAFGRLVYRNDFAYGDDAFGNPLPLWAAHAAAVKFLDGMPPVNDEPLRELRIANEQVWLASFQREDKRVWVAWTAGQPIRASDLPVPSDAAAYDTTGNPVATAATAQVDWRPIYFVK